MCLEDSVGIYSTPYSVEPLTATVYGRRELSCLLATSGRLFWVVRVREEALPAEEEEVT